jgi:branched-chain amino acid transport system permease protein
MTLLFGFAGQLSVAQSVFFGCGAYAMGILGWKTGLSPWLGLPAGIAIAMALAAVVGYPVLRLRGLYLAMATLGLNVVAVAFATQDTGLTGGAIGIQEVKPLSLFGHDLFGPKDLYYLALASFVLLFVLAYRLVRSPVGLMLTALRHDERAASLSGIHTGLLKTKVFVLAAAFAAVGGFWYVSSLLYASPDNFGIQPSFLFLIMVVIGGTRSLLGAILGAAFIVVLPQLIPTQPRAQEFIFAISFLLVALFAPRGLAGIGSDVVTLAKRAVRRRAPAGEALPER